MTLYLVQQEGSRTMKSALRAWRGRRLSWELSHSMENEVFLTRAISKRPSQSTQRELARAQRRTVRLRRKLDSIVAKSGSFSH
jgi:hypothetical protein